VDCVLRISYSLHVKENLQQQPNEQLYQEWALVAFYKQICPYISFHPVAIKTSACNVHQLLK
jgi:hypothetical protein